MSEKYALFTPMIFGRNSSMEIGRIVADGGAKKALLVIGPVLTGLGAHLPIVRSMEEAGIEVVVFDGVVPDPPDHVVNACGEMARRENVDAIVALGGGSTIDTAKGANLMLNNPGPIQNYFGAPKNLNDGVPLYCIPTTSGTGSDATQAAIITNTSTGRKSGMKCPQVAATLSIVDPVLAVTAPPELTAACGFDAIAHSIEAITGKWRNPVSEALGCNALTRLSKWLPVAVAEPDNLDARENVAYAATLAGMAFCNSPLHMGHACGHTIGALYHVPHGLSLSFAYPEVAEWLCVHTPDKMTIALEALGFVPERGLDPTALGSYAKNSLRAFTKSLGLPSLREANIPIEGIDAILSMCILDFGVASAPSPERPTTADFEGIFKSAFSV